MPQGQLVVVGTGIRTVGHMTMEAIAWIERSDTVIHLVADPIAEALIKKLHPANEFSLQGFYGEGKQRSTSYAEMVEFILSHVRSGANVCGAFYGHPGVFAYPPHESIRRARLEGYRAWMLPGISSEDCLFADLGVDPAVGGLQSYEATDFLMNARTIDPSSQLILWQVGALGDWTYKRGGYDLKAMPSLVQKLSEYYPLTHNIVIYEAAMFAGCPPTIANVPLQALNAMSVSAASTVYIPPSRQVAPDYRFAGIAGAQG